MLAGLGLLWSACVVALSLLLPAGHLAPVAPRTTDATPTASLAPTTPLPQSVHLIGPEERTDITLFWEDTAAGRVQGTIILESTEDDTEAAGIDNGD